MAVDLSQGLKVSVPLAVYEKRPFHFIVIGSGGTGGFLIPNLIRLCSFTSLSIKPHEVTIVDGDVVEEKNVRRQNFINADLGKNKAEVLAERYAYAFGMEVNAYPSYIENEQELRKIIGNTRAFPVVCGCVDNNKTRQLIHKLFRANGYTRSGCNMLWIDAGNEEWTGQVVVGYNYPGKPMKDYAEAGVPHNFYLPPVTQLYPDILQDTEAKFNSELSCDERAVSAPQTINANLTAANLMMNIISVMLTCEQNEGLKVHEVKFNSKTNTFTNSLNYVDELAEYDPV